jgi:hypothetical protein
MAALPAIPLQQLARLGIGLVCLVPAAPLWAKPDLDTYPPAATFRTLQLSTLACGRENTAEACDQARRQADPLLDHRRLSGSCKDALWQIRQLAVAAPANSLERRDPIDKAAREVTVFCRQPVAPAKETKPAAPAGGGGGSFSFGGGK